MHVEHTGVMVINGPGGGARCAVNLRGDAMYLDEREHVRVCVLHGPHFDVGEGSILTDDRGVIRAHDKQGNAVVAVNPSGHLLRGLFAVIPGGEC